MKKYILNRIAFLETLEQHAVNKAIIIELKAILSAKDRKNNTKEGA